MANNEVVLKLDPEQLAHLESKFTAALEQAARAYRELAQAAAALVIEVGEGNWEAIIRRQNQLLGVLDKYSDKEYIGKDAV